MKIRSFYKTTFFSVILLGGLLFLNSTTKAALTWTTTNIESGFVASSTRVLWDPVLTQFAVGYSSSDGTLLKFATSTSGSAWSSPITVLSTSGLEVSDTFFTTQSAVGTGYIMLGMIAGSDKRYLSSVSEGSTWSDVGLSSLDQYIGGQIQNDDLGNTYVVGRIHQGVDKKIVLAKTSLPPAVNVFASSTIDGPLSANATTDFVYSNSFGGAVAYTIVGDTYVYIATSTDMTTWSTSRFLPHASYGVYLRPRIKFDSNGKLYVVSVGSNDATCTTLCSVLVSSYASGVWTTEQIDTVGTLSFNLQHDISFLNGTTPIISYYNNFTGVLKASYKDTVEGSGCALGSRDGWVCADVATGLSSAPAVSLSTNGARNALIVYQDYASSQFMAAYASLPAAESSTTVGTAFPKSTKPTNPTIKANGGDLTSNKLEINVDLSVIDGTEVALSTNPDFYNVAWQPLSPKMTVKLQNKTGPQYVYAKFSNATGGISDTVFASVYYVAPQLIVPAPIPDVSPAPTKPAEPNFAVTPPPSVFVGEQPKNYDLFVPFENFDPFNAYKPTSGTVVMLEKPSCPERVNAFSLDGSIIQDAKKSLYLIMPNKKVACPVASYAVARSWGVTSFKKGSIAGYSISSQLPYRPGTIVRNSKTRQTFFVNTKGKLHLFPSTKAYAALGYGKNIVALETDAVLGKFSQSAQLTRTDMHPDGTLFVLDAKKGEYGILQERTIHALSKKTLLKFGEKIGRAVQLLPGESYPVGVRWD